MLISYLASSGTACDPAADRAATATATTAPSYPPAICQHGHDAPKPRHATRHYLQSLAAQYGQHVATDGLPVPQPATTAERLHGSSNPTALTSP